ncbi:MAG: GNAT family N-acetyltransferase [Alphaproteobacteria bacterium]
MTDKAESGGVIETTVTYLEMRAPPKRPGVPAPLGKLAILRAERPTVSFYRYLYNSVGGPWNWTDRRRIDDDTLRAIIEDPKVEIYVLYVAGVPAGYVELDRRFESEVELAYFGLMPEFVGRGLGSYFLDWAVTAAWMAGPERLWVHTCTLDHPRALSLYQRAGFVAYKQEIETVAALEALSPVPIGGGSG